MTGHFVARKRLAAIAILTAACVELGPNVLQTHELVKFFLESESSSMHGQLKRILTRFDFNQSGFAGLDCAQHL